MVIVKLPSSLLPQFSQLKLLAIGVPKDSIDYTVHVMSDSRESAVGLTLLVDMLQHAFIVCFLAEKNVHNNQFLFVDTIPLSGPACGFECHQIDFLLVVRACTSLGVD